MSCSSLKRSDVARVNDGSHRFTCHPHVYPHVEWTIPVLTPQLQTVAAFWLVLKSHPAEGKRLSWPGWFGEILRLFARPKTVIHPSTSRGGRESNSRPSSRKSNDYHYRLPIGMPIVPFIRAVFLSRQSGFFASNGVLRCIVSGIFENLVQLHINSVFV